MIRLVEGLRGRLDRRKESSRAEEAKGTAVERFWSGHTVNSVSFTSAEESLDYLRWRFAEYPLFRELMDLWGEHDGDALLDYGCGPGDDVVGLALFSRAQVVYGVDISPAALGLARERILLHGLADPQVRLLRVHDDCVTIPLESSSIDYVHCGGVIQHVSSPERVLGEFARVLRPEGTGRVMVYNRDSLYFHLYTAYVRMIRDGAFAGMSVEEGFGRNTDGPDCPVSRCYRSDEFVDLCNLAGLEAVYHGGYFATVELESVQSLLSDALAHPDLGDEHKLFLTSLEFDEHDMPLFKGRYAGIGGVFSLRPQT